ncbi:MAG TPA: SAF domain-containing protein [Acidimicrobiales bacterium]|nr:SAF domain-containing protein [Acidimicrobiales bacterium]
MRPAPARYPTIRRPPARLVVAALLALACGTVVLRLTEQAEAATARYGATATAWVARTDLTPGDRIGDDDVALEPRPAAFVPAGAVEDDPTGRRVVDAVGEGEVLGEHRLAGGDRRGVAALVPDGWRALAIPAVDAALPVEVGQRVDVLAAADTGDRGPAGTVVAEDGIVVHVADDATVTVAVAGEDAVRLVAALAGGYVSLALVG